LDNGLCLVTGKGRRNRSLPFLCPSLRRMLFPFQALRLCDPSGPQLPLVASLRLYALCGRIGVEQQAVPVN
jgi:hypothetical protein